ncbi:recombinase family protein, partial [Streptomyces albidochromogenes]
MTKTLTRAIESAHRAVHGLRAVDYLRVSTEEQTNGYGISYTGKRTKAHIANKGWSHAGTYADEGFSGSLDHNQRPDLKRLMADARQTPRSFDVVVVHEERAIGRRDRAFWPWVWNLEDLGIFVAVVRGDYDNTTEEGRSRMRKEQDRAEDERVTIRDRTQGGVQEKAEIGGHPGGVAPYGYRIENKGVKGESRIVLDKGDAHEGYPTLHRAFRHIVEDGMNPGEVEAIFNAERVPGPALDYWPSGSLRHALTSQAVQKAVRVFRNPKGPKVCLDADGTPLFGETVSIPLEPVFTKAQLERLNKALARTSSGPRLKEAAVYPLSRHIISTCGRTRTGVSNIGNDKGRAYRCTGKAPKGMSGEKCDCVQIDAATLESRVWSETCRMLEDPDRLRQMAQDWVELAESNGVDYEARVKELSELIEEQEDTIDATTEATARRARRKGLDKKATQEAITRATRDLEVKLADLEKLRDEAFAWQADMQRNIDRAHDLGRLADIARVRLHSMNARQQEDIMDLLDLRVTILGEAPRKTRRDDQISAWFRERERVVPYLTDDAWRLAEPVLAARKGRRPADARG